MADIENLERPFERILSSKDQLSIAIRSSMRDPKTRNIVVLVHGLGEHSGRYPFLFDFSALPVEVGAIYGLDLRGHGKTGGIRGHVDAFEDYLQDLQDVLHFLSLRHGPGTGLHLIGHSLGGLIVFRWLMEVGKHEIPWNLRSVFLSAPGLKIKMAVPGWKKVIGHALSRVVGNLQLPTGLSFDYLTHNPEHTESLKADPLCHQKASTRYFTEFLKNQEIALGFAESFPAPLFALLPGDDPVCDSEASVAYFRLHQSRFREKPCQWKVIPGGYHELFNEAEPIRSEALKELKQWLTKHLTPN